MKKIINKLKLNSSYTSVTVFLALVCYLILFTGSTKSFFEKVLMLFTLVCFIIFIVLLYKLFIMIISWILTKAYLRETTETEISDIIDVVVDAIDDLDE